MIEIKNLSFGYKNKSVLKNITLTIPDGSLNVLLGLNGAGKTTLFRCLLKQENISKGFIFLDGKDMAEMSILSVAKSIAFVPQINNVTFADVVVRDYIVEARTPYIKMFSSPGKEDYLLVEKYAIKMGICELLDRDVSTLSGGELQLVLIARALTQETPIIIMDEPTSALDLVNQTKMLKTIKMLNDEGKTIIFSSHDPNLAFLLNANVCLIHNSSSLAYGPSDIILNEDNLKTIYGDSVELSIVDGNKHCFIK